MFKMGKVIRCVFTGSLPTPHTHTSNECTVFLYAFISQKFIYWSVFRQCLEVWIKANKYYKRF